MILLYNEVNQIYVYMYIPFPVDIPPTPNQLPTLPSRSSQSTKLGFLFYMTGSH